ncbi:MAG: trimethylamine methyltransferase family protein [Sedimentisphaerales bacterium]|nr:trimethylamine methyltransferase family protein [Sedimentisphaerales bacterium]
MRPKVKFLSDELICQIISEATDILCTLGVEIHNKSVLAMLSDFGCAIDTEKSHAVLNSEIIEKSLKAAPASFGLYNVAGKQTHDFSGDNVYFTPGSTALHILDSKERKMRKAVTADYVNFVKVTEQLENIASTSTALISTDVPGAISDSYRLYLSLLYGSKPVVTGAFTIESFEVMKGFQIAVRGTSEALKEKPLTIFSCCPTSPLKWSEVTSQNLLDCAKYSIPVEFIAMPLSGFVAPVTLTGTLIQHTAETLSGVVISQTANPGTPILYGGSPAIFDVRNETTPMGAIETMMLDCAYNEIGKYINLPTQAYISLSDAKELDAQAGAESGIGAVLAGLSGINNISGPGMLDFESCLSLEKLVLDNEICGMTYRLIAGIEPKEDFPASGLFRELLEEKHLLISEHTRRHLKTEHFFPGPVIDRARRSRWEEKGSLTLGQRAHQEVQKLLDNYQPPDLPEEVKIELTKLMTAEARRHGQNSLPVPPE